MSEEDRSRIYAWLCEEMDEQSAEYLMSCLSPTPLPELATKTDLLALKDDFAALKADFAALKDDFGELRTATKADMADLRAATKADMLALKADFAALKDDFGELRTATKADFAALRSDVGKLFDLREADRAERAREREADRADAKGLFKWAVGIVCGIVAGFGTAILVAVLQTGAVA